uniref:Uncharacterized protein n=1 Tax=Aquila chrysaetos chrysaetos TaxID=223781 RepID=A0A663END6_AQUCH
IFWLMSLRVTFLNRHAHVMFWTDWGQNPRIEKASMDGKIDSGPLISVALLTRDNVCYRKLYWTDQGTDSGVPAKIASASMDGSGIQTLFTDMPRHIVVNPKNRYLFWADYGQNPKIERAFLDCTNRTVLVSEGIVTPRGLAIDHSNGYIYWVDDSLDMIARIQPDGGDVEIVRYGSRYPTPYGITVFGNSMIWVDRNLKKVFQASKEPGNTDQPTVIRDNINWLRDVTIYNSHFQTACVLGISSSDF